MVLTKPQLIAALRNKVRILLHLAGKGDETAIDFRTAKRRTLDYLFCCASASRTLSANDFSAFATIAVNASLSIHVTQSGLTGSAGFNRRPRFCR